MRIPRPPLRAVPLSDVLPLGVKAELVVTMSRGQWDGLLAGMYEAGAMLLELDDEERPVAAYQRAGEGEGASS
jgi:hypothetical protein